MKEPTIFVSVEVREDGADFVAFTKRRIWPSLLAFVNHYRKTAIPVPVIEGYGLTVITDLAIAIEGVLGDVIEEKLKAVGDENRRNKFNADDYTWKMKIKLFNELFEQKIEALENFSAIEVLFILRNHIAHGRTHTEISRRNKVSGETSKIRSQHKNYQKVREYLIEKRLLPESDIYSNVNVLWNLATASYFWAESKLFLRSLISSVELKGKNTLLNEFEQACS